MTSLHSPNQNQVAIRPFQYRDIEAMEQLCAETTDEAENPKGASPDLVLNRKLQQLRRWYGLLKILSLFPNPFQSLFRAHVAEEEGTVKGVIQISPFNRTRSTWRIDRIGVDSEARSKGIGSMLLRHCFEAVWEARTWLLEVNVGDKSALALYRQNGFQPLAQMTYWTIAPERLQEMAISTPDLPNLLPVSNADAQLLYQLDTASMPPQVRQVFDRHIQDFKTSFLGALIEGVRQWLAKTEVVSAYVFEPQRKAAIGYFQVQLSRSGNEPHIAQLTVHPAYTWLYPELLSQMARLVQDFPVQSLNLASADYQPEREAYLEQFGAVRVEHSLLMSRSVWHKLRESKLVSLEGLQLSEMLQSFQPTRKPVPGRMSWLGPIAAEPAAGPPSSEIKPLLTDSGNNQGNQINPLNFQNSESAATDTSNILPVKFPELPQDRDSPEKS
ncbi:MAG: GNAT family N-acetyltransferase [Oscillatoriales cyanobacterium]|uniref:GNAT family N-acetyltransferase n=1 Tax=Microcoleus anatoxicus PTRS2 TaxID=2705321 RepID=A0ABU8YJV8_9CYAN|nr:MAG: GNAT family N-acetyltransferase [Oscillatoriales cyanobacterium]TAD98686.1 MAG: GNAT family N-acetyltransferase [Oscillatoriales cyanobacterium]TAE07081.1 MAG: GNAT family N-acetyltransferase [Oscillatoriales cyanobacterium]TAF05273.1 MAG: GNAT family N-acetyltransferase [Oscillatoriales cyanobacterium]TAF41456.1 MAG: GNAT family N-acetyltransferase [Oscillatoriales cyanobacterium]